MINALFEVERERRLAYSKSQFAANKMTQRERAG